MSGLYEYEGDIETYERKGDISPAEFAKLHEAQITAPPYGTTEIVRKGLDGENEYVCFEGSQSLTEDIPFLPYMYANKANHKSRRNALIKYFEVKRLRKRIEELETELDKVRAGQSDPEVKTLTGGKG